MKFNKYRVLPALMLLICLPVYGCLSFRIYPGGMEPHVSRLKKQPYKIIGKSEGMASSFSLLWIIPVTPRPDINRAINEAVSKKEGDDLIDVRWWIERKIYILGMVTIIHVKGRVIKYHD